MATIPDTLEIADALARENESPEAVAAVKRLRVLHQLGATEAGVAAGLRQQVGELIAARDARPTPEAWAELVAERDALLAELEPYRDPPPGPFAVPVVQFRAGLIPMRLRLLAASELAKMKWSVILGELDILTVIYPREEPVASLLAEAVSDDLLSPAEALALRGGE